MGRLSYLLFKTLPASLFPYLFIYFSTQRPTSRESEKVSHGRIIAYDVVLALIATALVVLGILFFILFCRRRQVDSEENLPVKRCAHAYPLIEVDAATDGFNQRRVIGKGRLGTVYVAVMASGDVIAVKRINPWLVLSNPGFGFSSIVKSLSLAQHPHVVPIIGFSEAPGERIMIMEFMGMKSLDFYLHENSGSAPLLDWWRRFSIAAGVARGIEYLHEGMAPHVVHGSVKPSNVLFDMNFCPRVCDYGLSFLSSKERGGLVGYVDDEYWKEGGGVCKASDVYGFGVVLLELLSGRRCQEGLLVEWALPLIRAMRLVEVLDPRLVLPADMNHLARLAKVASACVGNTRKNRPTIVQVAIILNSLEMELSI
ncbi:serine/threonine-protein kinase-like protein ACR4 [Macadamia integrifolia]|uniref:serine/threonine-protein kinase-like protein ACR4 n=1 Tax=Macadamia integrifolia TaxID=60698 RepID=UPI001C531C2C|nr:serine/threonine-protein kinase-like protein ACR4 [Macadamia integrifolia]